MNEEEKTGKIIAKLLDHGLNDITPGTLYRLQGARRAALEYYQPVEKTLHAGIGISVQSGYHWLSGHASRILLTASLLLFLVIHGYWQINNRIDDAILTPIILTDDPQIGSQEIEDTVSDYKAADEDVIEETISHMETDRLETEHDAYGMTDSDDVARSLDSTEIQNTENTIESFYTTSYDQDPLSEADTNITNDDHLQNSGETIDPYDMENIRDSTITTNE